MKVSNVTVAQTRHVMQICAVRITADSQRVAFVIRNHVVQTAPTVLLGHFAEVSRTFVIFQSTVMGVYSLAQQTFICKMEPHAQKRAIAIKETAPIVIYIARKSSV